MSKPSQPSLPSTLISFHEAAAARGDGLHPKLAAALAKTGTVSGPPARPSALPNNVIKVTFSDTKKAAYKRGLRSA
ncbi:hypothetical protein [Labrenzia sp. PHM005]|uniref:hypothetical protein n=1 Tax=Labrenzia sp. PHM005 TaxID=2590016 RepID=UPI00113FC508|nr:hypothetical protein [Labrenzia sp. PHM005]QDG79143.1 hypothetical protein FJ695_26565 [Labrenzia sp. PHM005]